MTKYPNRNAVVVRASSGKIKAATSLMPEVSEKLDALCVRRGLTRSSLLRELVEREVAEWED